jgi:D-glycerate 3-kinase
MFDEFCRKHKLEEGFKITAREYFIPLAEKIKTHHDSAQKTYYVGINGCQGSGKSTLGDFLKDYLGNKYKLHVVTLSLDDFYLSQSSRSALAVKIHPLFRTRGVPGTHNVKLLEKVLKKLATADGTLQLPKFDKAANEPFPKASWPLTSTPVDIVILEGWCWGVPAQSEGDLPKACNDFEQQQDSMGVWRGYANRQLQQYYQPLYSLMDYWVMLKAPSFDSVYNWRLEQEDKLRQITPHDQQQALMSAAQIKQFIQYYQRLTEHGLKHLPLFCHTLYQLDDKRQIIATIQRGE